MLRWMMIILVVFSWPVMGCEKSPGGSSTSAQAGPTAPPPPIAPPQGPGPHAGLGGEMAQHRANEVMEQINAYKKRLEENPKNLEALIALGNANFDIRRFDKAKELYLRALEVDPENARVRTDLASAYRNLGDVELAFKELNRVLAMDPRHETALYNLGVLLLNDKQDARGAISTWEKLLAAHPQVAYATDLKQKIGELKAQAVPGKSKKHP